MKVNLLDHGYVRLVDSMGSDLSIVRNARVSHDAVWRTGKDAGKDAKLIKFLYDNNHNTPFESVVTTFEVKAPIFVFRQWHRHRTQSYNEVSARYSELPEEFYVPKAEDIGIQSDTDHQSRDIGETNHHNIILIETMREQNKRAFALYKTLLKNKVPRELARSVLPVATYSKMFATANLNNWFKFLAERCDEHAQYEIRVYADAILEMLKTIAPIAVGCFEDNK